MSRKNIKFPQLKYPRNYSTKFTQNTILLFVGFFAVIFGLYFISVQSSTTVLPTGNDQFETVLLIFSQYDMF